MEDLRDMTRDVLNNCRGDETCGATLHRDACPFYVEGVNGAEERMTGLRELIEQRQARRPSPLGQNTDDICGDVDAADTQVCLRSRGHREPHGDPSHWRGPSKRNAFRTCVSSCRGSLCGCAAYYEALEQKAELREVGLRLQPLEPLRARLGSGTCFEPQAQDPDLHDPVAAIPTKRCGLDVGHEGDHDYSITELDVSHLVDSLPGALPDFYRNPLGVPWSEGVGPFGIPARLLDTPSAERVERFRELWDRASVKPSAPWRLVPDHTAVLCGGCKEEIEHQAATLSKLTFGQGDIVIIRLSEGAEPHWRIGQAMNTVLKKAGLDTGQIPVCVVQHDWDIERLAEPDARRLYDALRKRFDGPRQG